MPHDALLLWQHVHVLETVMLRWACGPGGAIQMTVSAAALLGTPVPGGWVLVSTAVLTQNLPHGMLNRWSQQAAPEALAVLRISCRVPSGDDCVF